MDNDEFIESLIKSIRDGDMQNISRNCASSAKATTGLLTYRDVQGNTAFMYSVSAGYLDISRLLLKMGADANKGNNYGWTPFAIACYHGHLEIVKFLLANTSQNLDASTVFGFTALMCTVYNGRYQTTKLLINSGVDINSAGAGPTGQGTGMTPLMVACHKGYFKISKILLERGAEYNTQCQLNGWSALMYAANGMNISMKNLLKSSAEGGEDIESPAPKKDLINLLLQHGADVDLCNWTSKTAYDIAMETGQQDAAEVLARYNNVVIGDKKSKAPPIKSSISKVSILKSNEKMSDYGDSEAQLGDSDRSNWLTRFGLKKKKQEDSTPSVPPSFSRKPTELTDSARLSDKNFKQQSLFQSNNNNDTDDISSNKGSVKSRPSSIQIHRNRPPSLGEEHLAKVQNLHINTKPYNSISPLPSPNPINALQQRKQSYPMALPRTNSFESLRTNRSAGTNQSGGTNRSGERTQTSPGSPDRERNAHDRRSPFINDHQPGYKLYASQTSSTGGFAQHIKDNKALMNFLGRIELKNYFPVFEAAYLDLDAVLGLFDEDLKELGIKVPSHRKQLLNAFAIEKESRQQNSPKSLSPTKISSSPIVQGSMFEADDRWNRLGGSRSGRGLEESFASRRSPSTADKMRRRKEEDERRGKDSLERNRGGDAYRTI